MAFDLPALPDLELPDLDECLFQLLEQLPSGMVTTYGTLAEALGDKSAARWVGERLLHHIHTPDCVCHRVVRADGSLGRYVTGDPEEKRTRLLEEGVRLENDRVPLEQYALSDLQKTPVLAELQHWQSTVRKCRRSAPLPAPVRTIAAVDSAYSRSGRAVAAYVLCDGAGNVISEHTTVLETPFPYIPGYLSFRELPALVELFRSAIPGDEPPADVILVDGNGILHPRRAGIAVCLGVVLGRPTIGVGKSLHCGSVAEHSHPGWGIVKDGREPIGIRLPSPGGGKPIYVSPGHLTEFEPSAQLVAGLQQGTRLPVPIGRADRLSKQAARLAD